MPKKSWNNFKSKYQISACFSAGVSDRLTTKGGPVFDKSGKKLPTPYALFLEWAGQALQGDWASSKLPGGFAILVSDIKDAAKVAKSFGVVGSPKRTKFSSSTQQIGYQDGTYTKLAKALGYRL